MVNHPKFLIVDGYMEAAREELVAGGATTAGELYAKMLKKISPNCVCQIVYPSDNDASLPSQSSLIEYDGLAWTGCSLTVYDNVPAVHNQIELCRKAFEAKIPSFGSCWAAQIAVVAAGGICKPNPNGREMGIARKINLTPDGRAHPMYEGKSSVFDAFISHVDEITHLPPGSINLAGNAFTNIQAVSVIYKGGIFWGLQYHPEYDLHEMARLTWCRLNKLIELKFFENREAGENYVDLLETLHSNPTRKDIEWLLGVDADVIQEDFRQLEVQNWVNRLVLPTMQMRR